MDATFRMPGSSGPDIAVHSSSMTGGVNVVADGRPVPRGKGGWYEVVTREGSAKRFKLAGQWTGLRAVVDGTTIQLERPLRPWEYVLVLLPLALVVVGGAIGGGVGAIGSVVNTRVMRQDASAAVRVVEAVGVTVAVWIAWFVLVSMLIGVAS